MATFVFRRLLLAASVVVAVSFAAFVGFGLSLDPPMNWTNSWPG